MPKHHDITSYNFWVRIQEQPFVDAIYLYGSRARGDATRLSDIDLAILCPRASEADWLKIVDIIDNADTLLKIDYVRLDSLKNERLKAEIERDKVRL
jgi:predicted nucleotidyltransferase